MMKPTSMRSSRTLWSLVGTVGVHVALAALAALVLSRAAQKSIPRPALPSPIVFSLPERPRMRPSEPPQRSAPPLPLLQQQPPSPASAPAPRERLRRPTLPPPVQPGLPEPEAAVVQPETRDLRSVNLLPSGVLRRLSEESAGAGSRDAQRASDPSAQGAIARLGQQRVQGFVESELAQHRVRSGAIDPVWRDLETSVLDLFKPPEALVRSGRSTMTGGERFLNQVSSLGKQIWRSPAQLEPSTPGRGEFAERGPLGVPETPYRNGLAAQQSAAAVNAWRKPASWLRTEVELVSSAAGEIESIRVISTCGVKKLDALAVETIKQAARQRPGAYAGKRTVTTWAFESAYAANSPFIPSQDATGNPTVMLGGGFDFDETGLSRKNTRSANRYISDPQYIVGGNVHTKVSLLSLRELQE